MILYWIVLNQSGKELIEFICNQFTLSDIIAIIAEIDFPGCIINTLTNYGFQDFRRL